MKQFKLSCKVRTCKNTICNENLYLRDIILHTDTLFNINTKLDEMPRGREALQLWARLQLAAYSLHITNMSSDWRSGEAFCAIIHRYRT